MNTLHWHGFTALVEWLARGEVPVDGYGCGDQSGAKATPARPETAAQGAQRQADEGAAVPRAPVRWGNFR
jgi:hypothetical protein